MSVPTSIELWASSKIIGRECARVNKDFYVCKKNNGPEPQQCEALGNSVTNCATKMWVLSFVFLLHHLFTYHSLHSFVSLIYGWFFTFDTRLSPIDVTLLDSAICYFPSDNPPAYIHWMLNTLWNSQHFKSVWITMTIDSLTVERPNVVCSIVGTRKWVTSTTLNYIITKTIP